MDTFSRYDRVSEKIRISFRDEESTEAIVLYSPRKEGPAYGLVDYVGMELSAAETEELIAKLQETLKYSKQAKELSSKLGEEEFWFRF
jgi:hypothetical protein